MGQSGFRSPQAVSAGAIGGGEGAGGRESFRPGGVEADVLGDGLDEIPVSDRDAVLAAHPRLDLKRGIVQAFADGFGHKPATTFGTMNTDVLERTLPGYRRPNFCDLIAANPLGG